MSLAPQMILPMSSPNLTEAEMKAVCEVLETGHLSLGPKLVQFEKLVASYNGVSYGVGVNSGTSGLHLCIIASKIRDGDLVITTPFSFVASANCILYERGVPFFVDVEPVTGNIDPDQVAQATHDLQQGGQQAQRWLPPALQVKRPRRELKAILPVHIFGQPADMTPLLQVARSYDLTVIEDACEALGARYKGQPVGSLGDAAVFAFYPNKQITTGEGGVIVTNNEKWANLFRSLRNQGRDVFDAWLNHTRLGYNYRLDEMSAALGLIQMKRLEVLLAAREKVAGWYNERLISSEEVEIPTIGPNTSRMSWFVYVVRLKSCTKRQKIINRLAVQGIPSRPYFTPIHLQPFYRERFGYRRGDFPVAEWLGDVSLALPFSGVMREEQVEQVCERLLSATERKSEGCIWSLSQPFTINPP
jgi:perosamine synthetase